MDENLRTAVVHEFNKCINALNGFAFLMASLPKNDSKYIRLECFNLYSDFVKSLYEFYVAMIEHHYPKLKGSEFEKHYPQLVRLNNSEKLDKLLTMEVEKLFRNRKARIDRGIKDPLGYRSDFFECEIPAKFGEHFRFIRNKNSHTSAERVDPASEITLADFFTKYHKFVLIMFYENKSLWQVEVENYNFKEVEEFAKRIM